MKESARQSTIRKRGLAGSRRKTEAWKEDTDQSPSVLGYWRRAGRPESPREDVFALCIILGLFQLICTTLSPELLSFKQKMYSYLNRIYENYSQTYKADSLVLFKCVCNKYE